MDVDVWHTIYLTTFGEESLDSIEKNVAAILTGDAAYDFIHGVEKSPIKLTDATSTIESHMPSSLFTSEKDLAKVFYITIDGKEKPIIITKEEYDKYKDMSYSEYAQEAINKPKYRRLAADNEDSERLEEMDLHTSKTPKDETPEDGKDTIKDVDATAMTSADRALLSAQTNAIYLTPYQKLTISLGSSGKYYSKDEEQLLERNLNELQEVANDAYKYIFALADQNQIYNSLTKDVDNLQGTQSKIGQEINSKIFGIAGNVAKWVNDISNIIGAVEWAEKKVEETDPKNPHGGAGKGSVGNINLSPSYAAVTQVQDKVTQENIELLNSMVGTVLITGTIMLYDSTIGGQKVESSPTASYGLLGIQKLGEVYYYRIIDKATGHVYFTEITNNINIQTNYKDLLSINKPTAMLSSTEIGTDNFKKLADENTLYFINGQKEAKGINFVNVADPTDGKTYYVALSDSNSVVPLNSIVSTSSEGVK